jgi:hypothetical protein
MQMTLLERDHQTKGRQAEVSRLSQPPCEHEQAGEQARAAAGNRAPARAATGPRGCQIGDVIVAEGFRWRVVDIDLARREAVCSLIAGARVLHRFRARQIMRVDRKASLPAAGDAQAASADRRESP